MRDIAAIVYTSNTGFTMRYAQMLGQAAAIPVYDLEDGLSAPASGANVLYLGWLSAGKIKGLSRARKQWKIRAVCAVGMSPGGAEVLSRVTQGNQPDGLPVFYLPGGYAPEILSGVPMLMMWALSNAVTRKPPQIAEEASMQEAFRSGCDFVAEQNLAPVLDWLGEKTD